MEGTRVIVGDLVGYGMDSRARPGGLAIFSLGPLVWGHFFHLGSEGVNHSFVPRFRNCHHPIVMETPWRPTRPCSRGYVSCASHSFESGVISIPGNSVKSDLLIPNQER